MLNEILDQSSIKPKILIKGNERYSSTIGKIMTILSYTAILTLSGYFFVTFLQKSDLNIVYFKETVNFNPVVNLTDKFILFNIHDVYKNEIDPRVATVIATYWATVNGTRTIYSLETEPCSWDVHLRDPIYKEWFITNITRYRCFKPDNKNLTINSEASKGILNYYNFYVAKCVNTTENGNFCYTPDTINTKLRGLNFYFNYYFPNYIYDHYNVSTPVSLYFKSGNIKLNLDLFYIYYEYYKTLVYESDEGNVFEDYAKYGGFVYDDVRTFRDIFAKDGTNVYIPSAISVVQININAEYADRYRRYYSKLQSVLANIGGVLEFVFFLSKLISYYITEQMMYVDLSNNIINWENGEKGKPQELVNLDITQGKPIKVNNFVNESQSKLDISTKTTLRPKLTRKLTLTQSILPDRCFKKKRHKDALEDTYNIVKRFLSSDYIIRTMSEFERFKQVMLTDSQYLLFKQIKMPTLAEHINSPNILNDPSNNPVREANETPDVLDEITLRILKYT
jgi:hypothetical protein